MFPLHKLLAKLGYQTETYKAEIFKSDHPQYIVISTKVNDAMGQRHDFMAYLWNEYIISDITGQGVFFARSKGKVYIAVGKADMNLQLEKYTVSHTASEHRGPRSVHECSLSYRVIFDAVNGGEYRFLFHGEKHELQIVYEKRRRIQNIYFFIKIRKSLNI